MKIISSISCAMCISLFIAGCNHPQTELPEVYNVTVQKITMVDQNECGTYIGTVEPKVSIPLSFLMPGQVKSVAVSEGQLVRQGQLLAVLDNRDALSALRIAEAKDSQAQDAYNRLESVYKNGSLTEIKWVEMQSNLEQAHSMKEIALKNSQECDMYAPTDGYIGKRNIEPGMNTLPTVPVFELVKIEQIYVSIPVPENEISKLNKGLPAEISIPALGSETFTGKVEEIGVVADIIAHTYKVKIAVNNSKLMLKPGMVANVNLEHNSLVMYPVVPLKAILSDENSNKYLYVVGADNKAVKKIVKTGKLLSEGIVIIAGLEQADMVIVNGNYKLINGSPIMIVRDME